MNASVSVIIPFERHTIPQALNLAGSLRQRDLQVVLAGVNAPRSNVPAGVKVVTGAKGRGDSLRAAVAQVQDPFTLILEPDPSLRSVPHTELLAPLVAGEADGVFACQRYEPGTKRSLTQLALAALVRQATQLALAEPLARMRGFVTAALQSLDLRSDGDEIDSEILVKFASQLYRLREVQLALPKVSASASPFYVANMSALLRYATCRNDADNLHEGYNTLARMESAPRYNAWLGRRLKAHLGSRVLEVGAGIGTMTAQIEKGLELLVALEVDGFYVRRLENRFRDLPHVRPLKADVKGADWEELQAERLDTVVLSNVLEHIEDDHEAIANFRRVLQPGGRLVLLVPVLPWLRGSLDDAVGHFRRYTPAALRDLLESGGFEIESLEWLNLLGIPGWWLNGSVFHRRAIPAFQLRVFDQIAPFLAQIESRFRLPIGLSLLAVARVSGERP